MKVMKGQVSTYLKPMVLVILSLIFLIMIALNINYQITIQEQRQTYELRIQAKSIKDKIVNCLNVNLNTSKANILINKSKLAYYDEFYKFREPECMEDFTYGWNATIRQEFVPGVSSRKREEAASVMLVIDRSGSMEEDHNHDGKTKQEEAIEAAKSFVDIVGKNVWVGIVAFNDHGRLISTLTKDKNFLKEKLDNFPPPDDGTSLGAGISIANQELRVNGKGNLYEILLTDGCPEPNNDPSDYMKELQQAKGMNVKIFTIGFGWKNVQRVGMRCTVKQAKEFLRDIADSTRGKMYLAENLRDLKVIYSQISKEITTRESQAGIAETTCSEEPVTGYKGNLDIAFLLDSTASMNPQMECTVVENILLALQEAGLKVNYKVYGMPEDPTADEWRKKMNLPYPADDPHWTYRYYELPKCAEEVTNWSKDIVYNAYKDAMAEGWGVGVDYILDNHVWDPFSYKMIVVMTDQDPTGGCSGTRYQIHRYSSFLSSKEDFDLKYAKLDTNCERDYHPNSGIPLEFLNPWRPYPYEPLPGDTSNAEIKSEVELMDRIVSKARNQEVTIHFLYKREYTLEDQYEYGSNAMNDAIEVMEKVARDTDGRVFPFGNWKQFTEYLKDLFFVYEFNDTISTCNNVFYRFGESQGSFDNNLLGKTVFSFPVSIWHDETLTTSGTLFLEVRNGPLERLAGAINRVYELGKKFGSYETVVGINTKSKLVIEDHEFTRPKRTRYILSGGISPYDLITADDDLRVGIDGIEIFKDDDKVPTNSNNASYRGEPIEFSSLKGHSIQILVNNYKGPTLGIGPLYIHCCNGQIQKIEDGFIIDNRTNPEEYKKKSAKRNFYFNSTTINIGNMESYVERALCMVAKEKKRCVNLRTDAINTFELPPGEYYVKIRYVNGTVEVTR